MKFLMAIFTYLLIGFVLALGILLAVAKGSYWLLLASGVVYLFLFAWIGCLHHES